MTLRKLHSGGFLWPLERPDRDAAICRVAAEVGQLIVVSNSDVSAEELSKRLVLSGMPVVVGTADSGPTPADLFRTDGMSTLVATDAYLHSQAPFEARVLVHARVARSIREYKRRIADVQASVHLSFAFPEDAKHAQILATHLERNGGPEDNVVDLTDMLDDVVDLTDADAAATTRSRRRFPLSR